jgi:hypothetical protein
MGRHAIELASAVVEVRAIGLMDGDVAVIAAVTSLAALRPAPCGGRFSGCPSNLETPLCP